MNNLKITIAFIIAILNIALAQETTCDYPLAFSTSILHPSGEAEINIKLGEVSNTVTDVYAVSFTVNYDTNFIVEGTLQTVSINTWFGVYGENTSQIGVDNYANGKIDISITGLDLLNRSGGGDIIALAWTMEDDVIPIMDPFVNMNLIIDNIYIVNYEEDELEGCGVDTVMKVYKEVVSIQKIDQSQIQIFPNPASQFINIINHLNIDYVELNSLYGKKVQVYKETNTLDISNVSKGVYFLKIHTKEGIFIDKIIIE